MKFYSKLTTTLLLTVIIIYTLGCKKTNNDDNTNILGEVSSENVTVITYSPTTIAYNQVTCGVEVKNFDINYLSEIGVCWSIMENPTIYENYYCSKNVNEPFICTITDLDSETIYHVRAYALYRSKYYYGEDKSFNTSSGGNNQLLPTVITKQVTNIRLTSAVGGGVIINNTGLDISESGICWGTNHEPQINDNFEVNNTIEDNYELKMLFLESNTTYYVRAYAKNGNGIAYGEEVSFNTLTDINSPTGALKGLFSVGEDQEVYFSNGNLQYQASTNSWKFAENQWDYVGEDNENISSTYNGWIDLFGWGTSGHNHGAVCYQPWSTSGAYENYYVYGSNTYNLNDLTGEADWGANPIVNGGMVSKQWRTLTKDEWEYLARKRITSSGARFAKARVNGVNGAILFPDDWITAIYNIMCINNSNADYYVNIINDSDWRIIENAGAVFLPTAGKRKGGSLEEVGIEGAYWSATKYDNWLMSDAYKLNISNEYFSCCISFNRSSGASVRLVQDYQ